MNTKQNKLITNSFQKLDSVLERKAKMLYEKLRPGACDSNLAILRHELCEVRSPFLEAWFSWHNGALKSPVHLLPLGYILSISELIDDRRREGRLCNFRNHAIKLLEDGSGDGYFMDTSSNDGCIYYHMLQNPHPEYHGTLSEFVGFIADGFESDALYVDIEGDFGYMEDAYAKLERSYLSKVADRKLCKAELSSLAPAKALRGVQNEGTD